MELNKLNLLAGDSIQITDWLSLRQPTIEEIRKYGEDEFYSTAWTLCSSPWDMPSMLDDVGIDFMQISEWDFFRILLTIVDPSKLQILMGDVNFQEFQPMKEYTSDGNEKVVLYRPSDQVVFDEDMYNTFIAYLRELIGFSHKGKKAANKATAKIMIIDDRKERQRAAKKPKDNTSMIFDIILSLVNTEEFSYTYETVFGLTLYQLMKSFIQIQGKKSACALMQGSMSGFVDTKGIPSSDMTWTYSDDKYKPRGKKLVNNKTK